VANAVTSSSVLRLLLVDDDQVDREIVSRALRATGLAHELVEADAAGPAFERLAGDAVGFDVGLFDLYLPDRDGLELLTEVRAAGFDLPVIFLTGQGSEETAVELMKSGASDYLPKGSLSAPRLKQSIAQAIRLARTERAQRDAERALRESEANFRRLADNLPDAVVRFDDAGRYVYLNRPVPWSLHATGAEMLGLTIAEGGCGQAWVGPLEGALRCALDGQAAQVTLAMHTYVPVPGDPAARGEDEGPVLEEVPRWIEARFVPEFNAAAEGGSPQVMTVLGIARNVTAEVQRQADEQRRVEFEQQLIGIVSHDLRSPIGAILMASTLLKRRIDAIGALGREGENAVAGDDKITRTLDLLESSGQRAKRMVSDILDFTKARLGGGIPMTLAECDIGLVAAEVVAETRTAHPNRELLLTVTGATRGWADGDRMAQALSNLLGNAITYSNIDEPVEMAVVDSGNEVMIEVRNRGQTIAPEVLPMLFKPFHRGPTRVSDRDVSRSVGLGLFIVEQIVQGHGGRIEVTSADGLTSFRMIVPRRPQTGRMRAMTTPSGLERFI